MLSFIDTFAVVATKPSLMTEEVYVHSLDRNSSSDFGIIGLITSIFVYLFFSYCLYLLATKLGEANAWLAFIPFL